MSSQPFQHSHSSSFRPLHKWELARLTNAVLESLGNPMKSSWKNFVSLRYHDTCNSVTANAAVRLAWEPSRQTEDESFQLQIQKNSKYFTEQGQGCVGLLIGRREDALFFFLPKHPKQGTGRLSCKMLRCEEALAA
jgi:hypothetical protein